MTELQNPYAAPAESNVPSPLDSRRPSESRRPLALALLAGSTAFAVAWAYVNQFVLSQQIGPVPMIVLTTVASLLSAYTTRSLILAPLSCFLPLMSACALVGTLRGWSTVQYGNFLIIALGCSLSSFILALVLPAHANRDKPG